MTSAVLNSAEKTLLQYWLSDGAPGYSGVVMNANNQRQLAPLKASDYAAIGALDNDVIRGYLASYQVQKIAGLATAIANTAAQVTKAQAAQTALQASSTAIAAITVQTVPTSA
jgi:hypothetical protein